MVGFPLPVRSPAVKPASYHRSRTAARLNALTLVYIVYNAARFLSNKTLPALRLFQYFIFAHNYIKYRSQHRVTLSPCKKQFRASERRAAVGKSAMAGSPCGQVGDGREPLRASRRCPYLLMIERGRGVPRPPVNQTERYFAPSSRAKSRDLAGANTNVAERYASNTYPKLYVMRRSEGELPYRRLRRQIRSKK